MTLAKPQLLSRIALGCVVVIAGWVSMHTLDMNRIASSLASARLSFVALACICFASILPLWALQWTIIAPNTTDNGWSRMLTVVTLTSATLNSTPLLVGEVAGAVLLVRMIGLSAAQAVSVSVMDQLLVGIAKIVVLLTAALTNPLPAWITRSLVTLIVAVSALAAVCLYFAFSRAPREWPRNIKSFPKAVRFLSTVADSLEPLRSPRRFAKAVSIALAKKTLEVVAIIALQRAFGITVPPTSAILVLAALNVATILPVVPGNLGVYEAVVSVVYVSLGVDRDRAAALAITQHACFWASLTIPGYLRTLSLGASRTEVARR